jgi:peptidoglycan/LPS O-acetylase OafA/YrhL
MNTSFLNQLNKNPRNNLNAIRLGLAIAVILTHAYVLSYGEGVGQRNDPLGYFNSGKMTLGDSAVNLFFF